MGKRRECLCTLKYSSVECQRCGSVRAANTIQYNIMQCQCYVCLFVLYCIVFAARTECVCVCLRNGKGKSEMERMREDNQTNVCVCDSL